MQFSNHPVSIATCFPLFPDELWRFSHTGNLYRTRRLREDCEGVNPYVFVLLIEKGMMERDRKGRQEKAGRQRCPAEDERPLGRERIPMPGYRGANPSFMGHPAATPHG